MGKFGNSAADLRAMQASRDENGDVIEDQEPWLEIGTNIGPLRARQAWHGQSGFEAMGHLVPPFRRSAGQETLKLMGFDGGANSEKRHSIVENMCNHIERDNSHAAMEEAYKGGVDVTGVYRLLAVLLCEPQPEEREPEANFVDLVA